MSTVGTPRHFLDVVERRAERVGYLLSRWEDEKEYEDIADYRVALNAALRNSPYVVDRLTRSWRGTASCARAGTKVEFEIGRSGKIRARQA